MRKLLKEEIIVNLEHLNQVIQHCFNVLGDVLVYTHTYKYENNRGDYAPTIFIFLSFKKICKHTGNPIR